MNLTSLGNHESCYKKCHGTSAEMCMAWLDVLLVHIFNTLYLYICTALLTKDYNLTDRERCKGFRIPMKNFYLLNSLSKIIENNKPQPVPLFRCWEHFIYAHLFDIFFSNLNLSDLFSLSEIWCDHEDIVSLNYWTKP